MGAGEQGIKTFIPVTPPLVNMHPASPCTPHRLLGFWGPVPSSWSLPAPSHTGKDPAPACLLRGSDLSLSHLEPPAPQEGGDPPGLPRASAVPTRVPSQSQPPPTQGTCPPLSPVLPPHHYTGMCRRDLGPPHAIVNAGPSPHLHPRQAQACPLPPAGSPNTPVYLWASARDGSAPDSHPPPAHLPSHPFSPALQLSLFLLEVSVPVCVWGWGRRGIPVLSSAGAWPSAPGQRGMGGCGGPRRLPDSPRVAGACGGLPGGTEQALGVGGEGPQGPSSCPRPSPPSRLRIHGGGRMGQRWPVRGQKGGFFFGKTCRQHPRMNSRGASHHTVSSQSGDSRR